MKVPEIEHPAHVNEPPAELTVLQIIGSILASFYGVQSSKNRKRDFQSGKAKQFIIAGVVMTAVWYLAIYLVVSIVLKNAG
jgi:hypothetical protein